MVWTNTSFLKSTLPKNHLRVYITTINQQWGHPKVQLNNLSKANPADVLKRDSKTVECHRRGSVREGRGHMIYQNSFDRTKREITHVYLPGTMAHIKESEKEDIASPKAFMV